MSAENPTFNQISEQYNAGNKNASVLVERSGETISTGTYTGETKNGGYVVNVKKDGQEAYRVVDASEISDERQAEMAEMLAGKPLRQELGHVATGHLIHVGSEVVVQLKESEQNETNEKKNPRYERLFMPIEIPKSEKRHGENWFSEMLAMSDEEREERSRKYIADMGNRNSTASRQRVYESFVNDESKRESADYFRSTLLYDEEFAALFDTKEYIGKPVAELSEALRLDPEMRYKVGDFLMKKLETELKTRPGQYPDRVIMNTDKSANGLYEKLRTIKSREYVVLLALSKLDGSFNTDKADKIAYDDFGVAIQGQHRDAADTLLQSYKYASRVEA